MKNYTRENYHFYSKSVLCLRAEEWVVMLYVSNTLEFLKPSLGVTLCVRVNHCEAHEKAKWWMLPFATSCYRVMLKIKCIDHVLNTTIYSMTNMCVWFTWLGTASWNVLVTSSECQRKSLPEDMLCTSQPLAKGDLVNYLLYTLPMYKDCLRIIKEQCKNCIVALADDSRVWRHLVVACSAVDGWWWWWM